jgi:ribosome-associated protein
MSTEGEDNGEWIIVDCGAAVAHIMQPAIRDYYHLEEIWGGKAVRMKVGAVSSGLVKASEPEPAARPAAAAPRAGKAATSSAPRPPQKRPTAAKKAANKTAAFKRVSTTRTPARKAPRKVAGN